MTTVKTANDYRKWNQQLADAWGPPREEEPGKSEWLDSCPEAWCWHLVGYDGSEDENDAMLAGLLARPVPRWWHLYASGIDLAFATR